MVDIRKPRSRLGSGSSLEVGLIFKIMLYVCEEYVCMHVCGCPCTCVHVIWGPDDNPQPSGFTCCSAATMNAALCDNWQSLTTVGLPFGD